MSMFLLGAAARDDTPAVNDNVRFLLIHKDQLRNPCAILTANGPTLEAITATIHHFSDATVRDYGVSWVGENTVLEVGIDGELGEEAMKRLSALSQQLA